MGKIILIAAANYDSKTGKLGIGFKNGMPWYIPEDLKRFKKLTENEIVVMGRKTYQSIGQSLKNRVNIVLSQNMCFYVPNDVLLFSTIQEVLYYKSFSTKDLYIIGGEQIYKMFIDMCDEILLTDVFGDFKCDTFFPEIPSTFELNETETDNGSCRYLKYVQKKESLVNEDNYLKLTKKILTHGTTRVDRTGTGTIALFGEQVRYNISKSVPLLTTKFVSWKNVIHELIWILKGETSTDYLIKNNVKIWNGNTSRQFLDSIGKVDYPVGDLLYGYGHQLRHSGSPDNGVGGFDQLKYVENLLKTDPFSRRILWNLWNPSDLDKMVLQPCHNQIQFYVEEKDGEKLLSGILYMRSQDIFLGAPYNMFSYTALIYILALKCGMKPNMLIVNMGDSHIYSNHIEQTDIQNNRSIRSEPVLKLSNDLITKDWSEITIDDFELIGYYPHPVIKGVMAV